MTDRITDEMVEAALAISGLVDNAHNRQMFRKALAAALPYMRVEVKPLKWNEYKSLGGGVKTLAFDCFGNEFRRFDMRLSSVPQSEIDAAQADYERRIISALSHKGGDHG